MAVETISILGFMPDMPNTTPGAILSAAELIPSDRGMRASPIDALHSVLPGVARGLRTVRKLDGSYRLLMGTSSNLYEWTGSAWSSLGSGYTSNYWSMAQFGDATLASNDNANIQVSTGGSFSSIANAPKALLVITPPNFAIALNTQNGSASASFGDSPDRWWSSKFQDPTDWAISVDNQCVSERIIGNGGPITAAAVFGTGWVAYKSDSMFLAQYVGPPQVFRLQRIPGEFGCVGPDAVADVGRGHVFVSQNDILFFDGTAPVSLAIGKVKNYLFRDGSPGAINRGFIGNTRLIYEPSTELVWMHYPALSSTSNVMVLHLPSGRWGVGRGLSSVSAAGLVNDSNGIAHAALAESSVPSLKTMTGDPSNGLTMTTWAIGSDFEDTALKRVKLLAHKEPSLGTVFATEYGYSGGAPGAVTAAASRNTSVGGWDLRHNGRRFVLTFENLADCEFSALGLQFERLGVKPS